MLTGLFRPSLASGPPFLAVAEPTLLLFAFALGAFGGAIGDADALDALCLHRHLVLGGVECGICRDQARSATEPCLMGFDGSDQQVRIAGTPIVDFVVGPLASGGLKNREPYVTVARRFSG